jgi:hypothetical protein
VEADLHRAAPSEDLTGYEALVDEAKLDLHAGRGAEAARKLGRFLSSPMSSFVGGTAATALTYALGLR